jgi:hypothetical protein
MVARPKMCMYVYFWAAGLVEALFGCSKAALLDMHTERGKLTNKIRNNTHHTCEKRAQQSARHPLVLLILG